MSIEAVPDGFRSVRMCTELPPPLPGDLWQTIDNRSGKVAVISVASCIFLAGAPHQWHATFQEGSRHIQFSPAPEEVLRHHKYVPVGWQMRRQDFLAPSLNAGVLKRLKIPGKAESWVDWFNRMALECPEVFTLPNTGSYLYAKWRAAEVARKAA